MTIEELVLCIIENANKVSDKTLEPKEENDEKEIIYTINDLIDNYSIFTRYSINKAISEKDLPYFSLGTKKYFKKTEIDNWIQQQKSNSRRK